MIKKEYACASCGNEFTLEILEKGEPLPPNSSPVAPSCKCGSTALIDKDDLREQ